MDLKQRKLQLLQKKKELMRLNRLNFYDPYPFQVEFHNDPDQRKGLRAGNQIGKTVCGTVQDAFDLTGLYPEWYDGHRFTRPVNIVCGSINNDKTRDLLQKALCGDPVDKFNTLGTGWIPAHCLDKNKISLKRGVTDAFIHIKVRWHNEKGEFKGWSNLTFSSYESGKEAWMGDTIDVYHLDEEPPMDILGQAGRGCIASGGFIRLTWTPENGRTNVVEKVESEWSMHTAEWADAAGEDFDYFDTKGRKIEFRTVHTMNGVPGHITQKTIELAKKDNPPWMMDMRMKGIPVMGEGLVLAHGEDKYKIDPIPIPSHWKRIDGLDFGGLSSEAHPSAFARLAYDEENDILYVYDGFRLTGKEIPEIAIQISMKKYADSIPVVWPHDGHKITNSSNGQGARIADQYADAGVNMYYNYDNIKQSHATNAPAEGEVEGSGGYAVMPSITEISTRIDTGRFKVFSTVNDWWEEVGTYHMKDGKIVDRNDDFISAVRYCVMMKRHAVSLEHKPIVINTENHEARGWMGA